ncbi:MAG: response regulator [Microscillaceae bacterium]|nr:response regulator [Microscillaceae bacterium]MDW8460877.1 response regulator [Cytophagales bacterium]
MNSKLKHILIIDDDKTFAFITFKILKKIASSARIELKMSGQTGLQYLEICDKNMDFPHLITLDLNMPLGDGEFFLKHYQSNYKNKYPGTKIVVISDMAEKDIKAKTASYPFVVDYLKKPIDEEKLAKFLS